MAHRLIQAKVESAAVFDPTTRHWRMGLFNEDGTPFSGGGGGGGAGTGEWTPLTLINGWVNYDEAVPVAYRLENGGESVRFRGLADGRSRSNLLGNYKFADIPAELSALDTSVGVFVWRYGVGYEVNKFEMTPENDFSLYLNDSEAQRIGMLEGITVGLG